MVGSKKNNPAEDLMEALLKEVGKESMDEVTSVKTTLEDDEFQPLVLQSTTVVGYDISSNAESEFDSKTSMGYERTRIFPGEENSDAEKSQIRSSEKALVVEANPVISQKPSESLFGPSAEELPITHIIQNESGALDNKTIALEMNDFTEPVKKELPQQQISEQEKTVAVTGFQLREVENHEDKIKVAIGQNRPSFSPGYASWGGGSEASLGQAENLRIAQEKILDLEKENEKLRLQNEELLSASEIIKERSDLLTAQVNEYKNDKDGLEESFKNEIALLKGHLNRKNVENQKAQIKIDDLDSRLKFDMKKIRIRERELENRLELIRAEKNALMKSKDEQILDLRRKMDVMQMEVESYRQKCIDLNKSLEVNQESFKRTTRALRLAMANLELQEENKISLKKVD